MVARCTVQRLMREAVCAAGSAADPAHHHPGQAAARPADLFDRDFHRPGSEPAVGRRHHLRRDLGRVRLRRLHLRPVRRRIVGWRVSTSLRSDLALDALEHALWATRRAAGTDMTGLVHHSDRGVQYLSIRYTERFAAAGAVASCRPASATPTTTPPPNRSSACSRPNSSADEVPGEGSTTSSWRPLSGSTGSTADGCTAPAATSRQRSSKSSTTVTTATSKPSRPNNRASTEPGAVHSRNRTQRTTLSHRPTPIRPDRQRQERKVDQAVAEGPGIICTRQ